ncbi:MAG TPA: helix-turn-helix transcriptional regulator [Longimicrobiales bacterium]|nr:helix-turn-helix transcriptional regulator [Longimicrobiales bacterium]
MPKGSHLGDLEELVLLAVLRLGGEAYGARIRRELKERAGRAVSVSTIYVTLMRLEEKGYARSWKGEPTSERGGKAKRHYEVAQAGVEALEQVRDVRERMWDGVPEGATHG